MTAYCFQRWTKSLVVVREKKVKSERIESERSKVKIKVKLGQ